VLGRLHPELINPARRAQTNFDGVGFEVAVLVEAFDSRVRAASAKRRCALARPRRVNRTWRQGEQGDFSDFSP
jgi:hypothetical protein